MANGIRVVKLTRRCSFLYRRRKKCAFRVAVCACLAFTLSAIIKEMDFASVHESERELKVAFVRGGHFGIEAVDYLLRQSLPDREFIYLPVSTKRAPHNADLVVEGPPLFADGSYGPCAPTRIPWIQYIAEPGVHYDNKQWCEHSTPSIVRLDTSLVYQNETDPSTVFLWTPYGCKAIVELSLQVNLSTIREIFPRTPMDRDKTLAWVSQNCASHRLRLWNSILHRAETESDHDEIHALGACAKNVNFSIPIRGDGWFQTIDVYSNYRFVLALENKYEKGYVSEKLVTAIASGAIPIYFGDSLAARILFNRASFVDASEVFASSGFRTNLDNATDNDWDLVAKEIFKINNELDSLRKFSTATAFPSSFKEDIVANGYPNKPFPPTCLHTTAVTQFDAVTMSAFWAVRNVLLKD